MWRCGGVGGVAGVRVWGGGWTGGWEVARSLVRVHGKTYLEAAQGGMSTGQLTVFSCVLLKVASIPVQVKAFRKVLSW